MMMLLIIMQLHQLLQKQVNSLEDNELIYNCIYQNVVDTCVKAIKNGNYDNEIINYNNNPILKWCLSNTAVDIDKNDNIQPIKTSNQRRRIDGLASLLDAYVQYERVKQEYESVI